MSKLGTVASWVGNRNGWFFMDVSSGQRFPVWKCCHPDSRMAGFGPCPSTVNSHMAKIFQKLEKNPTLLPCGINIPVLSEILALNSLLPKSLP